MNTFILALCLIGAVTAHHGGDHGGKRGGNPGERYWNETGCEDHESVKGINATTCCPSLPHAFGNGSWKACEAECEKAEDHHCCKISCVLKKNDIVDASGKLDVVKTKAHLLKVVNDSLDWNTDALVDQCVASAPEDLKKWQEKQAANPKNPKKACANAENLVIAKCLRRGLHLNCPVWQSNEECDKLKAFAEKCPAYPAPRGPCNKQKGGEKNDSGKKPEPKKGGEKKETPKKDDQKKEASKKSEEKKETPKKADQKKETPKKSEEKKETPKKADQKKEAGQKDEKKKN